MKNIKTTKTMTKTLENRKAEMLKDLDNKSTIKMDTDSILNKGINPKVAWKSGGR